MLFDAADILGARGGAPAPITPRGAPSALAQLKKPRDAGPHLIFPPDGAAVSVEALGPRSRGLVLSATGKGLRWYVDGEEIAAEPGTGKPLWRPPSAGFYDLSVVDEGGRQARARVRINSG